MNQTFSRHGRPTNRAPGGRSRFHSSRGPKRPGRSFGRGNFNKSAPARRGGGRKMPSFDPSRFINTNPVDLEVAVYEPKHKFGDFGLEPRLVRTLSEINLQTPSPIQDQIIPLILEGKDVVGIAETGTGKTAAFLLPLIHKTLKDYKRQTLILTPTRELAVQIEAELIKLSRGFRLYSTVCIGGTNIRAQMHKLRKQNHFIIATPGRLMDLFERRDFNPAGVTTVVLDEADRMLDMGFIDPIREILGSLRPDRETLFFSATMDARTEGLVSEFLKAPVTVSVKKKAVTNSIKQDVVPHGHHDKFETLTKLLSGPTFKRVMIFGAMKHSVEKLAKELSQHGIPSESIHGNKSHPQRQRALTSFKAGKVRVLVATDVAARGIHVDNVSHVINYDLPNTFEDYVHRIGRTGRGNERGEALTFIHSS